MLTIFVYKKNKTLKNVNTKILPKYNWEIQILDQAVDMNYFRRKGKREREFFGWTDRHAREQERQANGSIISYLILLEITARLMEHNNCILK